MAFRIGIVTDEGKTIEHFDVRGIIADDDGIMFTTEEGITRNYEVKDVTHLHITVPGGKSCFEFIKERIMQ